MENMKKRENIFGGTNQPLKKPLIYIQMHNLLNVHEFNNTVLIN